jgi:hypothetical protein
LETRIFDGPADDFIQKVLSQRCIISYGDNSARLRALCSILKTDAL